MILEYLHHPGNKRIIRSKEWYNSLGKRGPRLFKIIDKTDNQIEIRQQIISNKIGTGANKIVQPEPTKTQKPSTGEKPEKKFKKRENES